MESSLTPSSIAGLDLQDWKVIEKLADDVLRKLRNSEFANIVGNDTLICISRISHKHVKALTPSNEED